MRKHKHKSKISHSRVSSDYDSTITLENHTPSQIKKQMCISTHHQPSYANEDYMKNPQATNIQQEIQCEGRNLRRQIIQGTTFSSPRQRDGIITW